MAKILDGRELAGFVKERQARQVRTLKSQGIIPRLVIIRDSDNPVITKYVDLKCRYGADIGVKVDDMFVKNSPKDPEAFKQAIIAAVENASADSSVHGIIVQLPLTNIDWTDEVLSKIAPEKDVDGLSGQGAFDSATATAISWLLAGYDIPLAGRKIAIVGRGRLVGSPLIQMWQNSGYDLTAFDSKSDLSTLKDYEVIITATGHPHLIKADDVRTGAVVVDAGTASEDGVLVGDIDDSVRQRDDLAAITPHIGGVGPLTVSVLFEDVISAASHRV